MSENYVEVKIEDGILRGQQKISDGLSNKLYWCFQGIPFAKPPVGDLRFKDPQPVDPWDGVRDALKDGPGGPQCLFGVGAIVGEEDCLYLNVFTPELPEKNTELKPVLFNIHGGGFGGGSGGVELYSPNYFIEHDVVFVSPNYRVGALGFLSLQNDEISGNAGLKDQVQALLWTKNNIRQFGGDPDNVTIMGLSAGGASVEYLLLTELTKGLFKRAIIQSGSSLNTWAMNKQPRQLAVKLAELLGYTGSAEDDAALETFHRSCSAKDIVEKQADVLGEKEKRLKFSFTFGPCAEKEGEGQKFITRTPREILESGNFAKVPLITGYTNNEGGLYIFVPRVLDKDFEELNNDSGLLIPLNLDVPEEKKAEVGRQIKQYFFDLKPLSRDNIQSLFSLIGNLTVDLGISEATQYYLRNSQKPVYCYGVSYESTTAEMKKFTAQTQPDIELQGVPHGGDIGLMYKLKEISNIKISEPSETDKKYIKIVTTMLTTFAKTGNPNYEGMEFATWQPATTSDPQYLDIGNELKMVPGRLHEEELQFWNKLYEKYGHLY